MTILFHFTYPVKIVFSLEEREHFNCQPPSILIWGLAHKSDYYLLLKGSFAIFIWTFVNIVIQRLISTFTAIENKHILEKKLFSLHSYEAIRNHSSCMHGCPWVFSLSLSQIKKILNFSFGNTGGQIGQSKR